jgi:hypothetical protein
VGSILNFYRTVDHPNNISIVDSVDNISKTRDVVGCGLPEFGLKVSFFFFQFSGTLNPGRWDDTEDCGPRLTIGDPMCGRRCALGGGTVLAKIDSNSRWDHGSQLGLPQCGLVV